MGVKTTAKGAEAIAEAMTMKQLLQDKHTQKQQHSREQQPWEPAKSPAALEAPAG
jgi:hypothetical protein